MSLPKSGAVAGKISVRLLFAMALATFAGHQLQAQQMSVLNSGTQENLRGISALPNGVAWASGTHGTYLKTADRGTTWSVAHVPQASDLDFRGVEAFSTDTAYLLSAGPGELSRIYKTINGGNSWDLQYTNKDPKGFLDCMAFWDASHGIVVGDPVNGRFTVLLTEDGGRTWDAAPETGMPPAQEGEGAFAASGTCVAVSGVKNAWFVTGGTAARIFRSHDSGKTWEVSGSPIVHNASAGIFSVAFRDDKHGVIAGGDHKNPSAGGANLALSDDGGKTWKLSDLQPQWYFSAVAFTKQSLVAIGSARSGFARDETSKNWSKTWDQGLNAVSSMGSDGAIAVGASGKIVLFTNLR
jgi:photosystem II stability/assembly factor-like uncharacterized protein